MQPYPRKNSQNSKAFLKLKQEYQKQNKTRLGHAEELKCVAHFY